MSEEKPKVRLPIVDGDGAPLRDDLDDGLRFLHAMGMQTKGELFDAQAKLYALVEELVAAGKIDLMAFEDRRARIRERELGRQATLAYVQLGDIPDKYKLSPLPDIDCESLLPICHARCCNLIFPLSPQDLDEHVVEWDYRQPYRIRHNAKGSCVHVDGETHQCTVYEKRPGHCRTYDCREDKRIWKDWEKKIPNDIPPPVRGRARAR